MKKCFFEKNQKELDHKLKRYRQMSKALKKRLKPLASSSISFGAAFLAVNPIAEGGIVYSGTQNLSLAWGVGLNDAELVDINAGGNDISFRGYDNGGNPIVQARDIGDFDGGVDSAIMGFVYFEALDITYQIGASRNFRNNGTNNLVYQNAGEWGSSLPNGSTKFFGIRLTGALYGWVRITKNGPRDYTIVDWAYDDAGNAITPSTTLPVELIHFKAKTNKNSISLNWQTASETNNAGFEIQRSTDGKNFQNLTFIEGNGTSFEENEYFFDDKELRKGQLYYYRLKQIDFDGQFEFSKVITAQLEGSGISGVFSPNPSDGGQMRLDYQAASEGELTLRVFDVSGKELLIQTREAAEGANRFELDFGDLGAGMFFVKMEQGGQSSYRKLMIK